MTDWKICYVLVIICLIGVVEVKDDSYNQLEEDNITDYESVFGKLNYSGVCVESMAGIMSNCSVDARGNWVCPHVEEDWDLPLLYAVDNILLVFMLLLVISINGMSIVTIRSTTRLDTLCNRIVIVDCVVNIVWILAFSLALFAQLLDMLTLRRQLVVGIRYFNCRFVFFLIRFMINFKVVFILVAFLRYLMVCFQYRHDNTTINMVKCAGLGTFYGTLRRLLLGMDVEVSCPDRYATTAHGWYIFSPFTNVEITKSTSGHIIRAVTTLIELAVVIFLYSSIAAYTIRSRSSMRRPSDHVGNRRSPRPHAVRKNLSCAAIVVDNVEVRVVNDQSSRHPVSVLKMTALAVSVGPTNVADQHPAVNGIVTNSRKESVVAVVRRVRFDVGSSDPEPPVVVEQYQTRECDGGDSVRPVVPHCHDDVHAEYIEASGGTECARTTRSRYEEEMKRIGGITCSQVKLYVEASPENTFDEEHLHKNISSMMVWSVGRPTGNQNPTKGMEFEGPINARDQFHESSRVIDCRIKSVIECRVKFEPGYSDREPWVVVDQPEACECVVEVSVQPTGWTCHNEEHGEHLETTGLECVCLTGSQYEEELETIERGKHAKVISEKDVLFEIIADEAHPKEDFMERENTPSYSPISVSHADDVKVGEKVIIEVSTGMAQTQSEPNAHLCETSPATKSGASAEKHLQLDTCRAGTTTSNSSTITLQVVEPAYVELLPASNTSNQPSPPLQTTPYSSSATTTADSSILHCPLNSVSVSTHLSTHQHAPPGATGQHRLGHDVISSLSLLAQIAAFIISFAPVLLVTIFREDVCYRPPRYKPMFVAALLVNTMLVCSVNCIVAVVFSSEFRTALRKILRTRR